MTLIRQMLFGLVLCWACGNLANGQDLSRLALPDPIAGETATALRLVRLPAITPLGLPGAAFSDWHRSDLQLAPDRLNDSVWGSGRPTKLAPWRLLPDSSRGWSLTGWVDIGGTANPDQPASRFNGPLTFNDRTDLQLNQLYLSAQRSSSGSSGGWHWGGRVDLLLGTDYIFAQSTGFETQPNGDNALNGRTASNGTDLYGLAIPQAYAELGNNQLNLRLGRFYTIVGYEGVPASNNFFYSHSYALQYGEPLTHTGGLLAWSGERMTVQAGVVNGWDKTYGVDNHAAALGAIALAGQRSSLGLSVISGREDGITLSGERTMYSLVWQAALSDRLAYVLQHDFAHQRNALGADVHAQWYGVSQYLFCALTDAWKVGLRYEWFRDDDGTRLSGMYVRDGGLGIPATGFAGTYYNATLGANWTPNANLTVRPEIRWDWSQDTGLAPFADFTSDSQFTLAMDAVYIF